MTSVTTTPHATVKTAEDDNKSDVTVIVIIITVLFVVVLTAIVIVSVGLLYKRRYHTRQVASFDDQHGS